MKIRIKANGTKVRMTVGDQTLALTPEAAVKLAQVLATEAFEARPGRVDWKAMADGLSSFIEDGLWKR